MSDQLTAWLRTVVPTAWAALVAFLVSAGAPEWLTAPLGDAGTVVVVPITLGATYAALRAVEPHMPAWLTRIVLGSNSPPNYLPPATSVGDARETEADAAAPRG